MFNTELGDDTPVVTLKTERVGDLPVVTATEYIDFSNIDAVRQELLAAAAAYDTMVVADLTGTFLDAAGMRMIAEIANILAVDGGELRAVITRSTMLNCLAMFHRDSRMRIFPTLAEALSAGRQNSKPWPHYQAA